MLLTKQFAVAALVDHRDPAHVSMLGSRPRSIRGHVRNALSPNEVNRWTRRAPIPKKTLLQEIHTEFVGEFLRNDTYTNGVLGRRSPPIAESEKTLVRGQRTALAHLRCGHSWLLNSYKHRIGKSATPDCLTCGSHEHTAEHLFSCASNHTHLVPDSLWTNPKEVSDFLQL